MRSLLKNFNPDEIVDEVYDIDVSRLANLGIKAALIDMDNTILPWRDANLPESSVSWVNELKESGIKVCILSNTHSPERLRRVSEKLGVESVAKAWKPFVFAYKKGLSVTGTLASETVMIGDQLMTDVWGANKAGIHSVLVRPMHSQEFIGTKLNRLIERVILSIIGNKCKGTKAGGSPSTK